MIEEIKPGLFIQKTKTGNYRMVKPLRKDVTKPFNFKTNCNYINLILGGSWSNFFTILFVVSIMMLISFGYAYDTKQCREIISDPIGFCFDSNACASLSQTPRTNNPFQDMNFTINNPTNRIEKDEIK